MKATALHTVFALICTVFLLTLNSGCVPVVVGAAAEEGYKASTDKRTLGTQLDDTTVSLRVKSLLIQNPDIPGRKIDVDVLEGHVMLTGVVDTEEQVAKALAVAKNAQGVKKVTNNLQVGVKTLGQSASDTRLFWKVKAALIREPDIRSLNVDVDVDRAVVTLSGIIDTQAHKDRVIELARTTKGVVKVVDLLTVR